MSMLRSASMVTLKPIFDTSDLPDIALHDDNYRDAQIEGLRLVPPLWRTFADLHGALGVLSERSSWAVWRVEPP